YVSSSKLRTGSPNSDTSDAECGTALLPVRGLLEQRRHVALAFLQVRHAVLHPIRLRGALQEIVEVLSEMHGPVLLILALAEAVFFAVVGEHVGLFAKPAHRGEELDPLLPWHRVILVVGHRQT